MLSEHKQLKDVCPSKDLKKISKFLFQCLNHIHFPVPERKT